MRVACELGKYPDEIERWMTPKWVTRWAAYFSAQRSKEKPPESEMGIDGNLESLRKLSG